MFTLGRRGIIRMAVLEWAG